MCTLSYAPLLSGFLITSNRDELKSRLTSPPSIIKMNGVDVILPIDQVGHGTWIAASQCKIACLLNGGFVTHKKTDFPNTVSRGVIIKQMFESEDEGTFLEQLDCRFFEPFTLVIFSFKIHPSIHEFVWDGRIKKVRMVNPSKPKVWSSSTLYSETVKKEREVQFEAHLSRSINPQIKDILNMHLSFPVDLEYGFRLNRPDGIETVSVSQILVTENALQFSYLDITQGTAPVSINMPL